jgi:hypothetical protein
MAVAKDNIIQFFARDEIHRVLDVGLQADIPRQQVSAFPTPVRVAASTT